MARLQILELPEGANDERPPFVLVVDQVPTDEAGFEALRRDLNTPGDLIERIGARAVLVFETTVDIPANEVSIGPDGYPVRLAVEGDFEQFRDQVQDEIRKAQAQVAQALREARRLPVRGSIGRPTHPDGTPYNYSEIAAGGWEHCDGCRTWGQWTPEQPHDCPDTYIKGPAAAAPSEA